MTERSNEQGTLFPKEAILVHDYDTTSFVYSKIGNSFHDVKPEVNTPYLSSYILDNTWRVIIMNANGSEPSYFIEEITVRKAKAEKKAYDLMLKTGIPKEVCKLFVRDFSEKEALIILKQVREDKLKLSASPRAFGHRRQYLISLAERTGVKAIYSLRYQESERLCEYVFGSS